MSTKPTSYPDSMAARSEHEWKVYDEYYSAENLEQPYFYHHAGRERRFVKSLVSAFGLEQGASLLDVGCGNGIYSEMFQQAGLKVTGLDRSEKVIDYCRGKFGDQCEWLAQDAFDTGREAVYDYAFCFWFMYFNAFDRPEDGAADAARLIKVLKPGGRMFFLWHSDLSGVRLPVERFSVMNFTLPQLAAFFPGFKVEGYAIDTPAHACGLLGRYSFNKYVTRLSQARVNLQASSWKRARLMIVVHNNP